MFGYVVINKPELKFKEFDVYKGYYCGLCHCLKERYGITGQVTLTYDMTFLSLLLTSLYEAPATAWCIGNIYDYCSNIMADTGQYILPF